MNNYIPPRGGNLQTSNLRNVNWPSESFDKTNVAARCNRTRKSTDDRMPDTHLAASEYIGRKSKLPSAALQALPDVHDNSSPPRLRSMKEIEVSEDAAEMKEEITNCRIKFPREILIGEAGANLVLSKLQAWGIPSQAAMAGLAYDIVADIAGAGLVRIQVKTTTRLQGKRYAFLMKRGFYYSRQGNFGYESSDYDIAAFVCLPLARVCFCAAPIKRFSARPDWFLIEGIEWQTLQMAVPSLMQCDSPISPPLTPNNPIQSSTISIPGRQGRVLRKRSRSGVNCTGVFL